jgi:hypothetical protein
MMIPSSHESVTRLQVRAELDGPFMLCLSLWRLKESNNLVWLMQIHTKTSVALPIVPRGYLDLIFINA